MKFRRLKRSFFIGPTIPGQVLAIISADCVPILLFDSKKRVVGALHGGRECLIKGIIKEAIRKMRVNFNSIPIFRGG